MRSAMSSISCRVLTHTRSASASRCVFPARTSALPARWRMERARRVPVAQVCLTHCIRHRLTRWISSLSNQLRVHPLIAHHSHAPSLPVWLLCLCLSAHVQLATSPPPALPRARNVPRARTRTEQGPRVLGVPVRCKQNSLARADRLCRFLANSTSDCPASLTRASSLPVCFPLSAGHVSGAGATSCTQCAAGTYRSSTSACSACASGSISAAGANSCTGCTGTAPQLDGFLPLRIWHLRSPGRLEPHMM